jgi:hypothetical protein
VAIVRTSLDVLVDANADANVAPILLQCCECSSRTELVHDQRQNASDHRESKLPANFGETGYR